MIPIPDYIKDELAKPNANFSLLFPRFVDWNENGEFKKRDDSIEQMGKMSNGHLAYSRDFLKKISDFQNEYITSVNGKEISAKLISPFITGLGAGHPTETGMILDRNTGVPYIPASTIKGVVRTAYAVNISDESGKASDDELDKIFGSLEHKGKIVFLDAYPKSAPTIQCDIMNPHFGKYYSGDNKLPLENENPVPIKFLSVKPGATFVFRYVITDENTVKTEDIEKAFETAFSVIGFGGKTSIGYGRFEWEQQNNTISHSKDDNSAKNAPRENTDNIDNLVKNLSSSVL